MAKTKHKKQPLSDKVRSKKNTNTHKINPFEVKINRQKHEVLNKKVSKFDKGRPGVSRSRAIQKRKETLLVEYKKRGKINTLMDKRFGESSADLSVEEKMLQRFALERKKHHEKPGAFNLQEDDTLTHYGQSLAEIEKFEDPLVSDEEDLEDRGKISGKLVAEEHFGGGVLKKSSDGDTDHKSWKERMEEVIAKSKKDKYERQHEKEKTRAMTEQLDNEWKELRLTMASSMKKNDSDENVKKTVDDYDITVRELQFEIKGKASDRLKTEEEIAKEEKEKLEKLEADRMRRMKGESLETKSKHRSADDLDDGFGLEPAVGPMLWYKDGKRVRFADEKETEGSEGEGENTESDTEQSQDGDDSEQEEEELSEAGESADNSDSELGNPEDDVSDLESSEGEEEVEESCDLDKNTNMDKEKSANTSNTGDAEDIREMLKKKKHEMEEARKELPYTFTAPETYSDLVGLLSGHHDIDQVIIVERLRACHHPSLAEGNKDKLEKLFTLLLQYYCEQCFESPPRFRLLDKLLPHLYELCVQSPITSGRAVLDTVIQRQAEYNDRREQKGGRGIMPTLDVLMLLKLVSILFPTSDKRHTVVTPTFLFISQILTQSCVQTTRDVAVGLFMCNLVLEYVSFSKRFVPEVINFLKGVLFLALNKDSQTILPVIPPFKPIGKYNNLLCLAVDQSECSEVGQMKLNHIFTPQKAFGYLASDEFRLCSIQLAISLLNQFSSLYQSLPSYPEIFAPVQYFVKRLPTERYPQCLKHKIQSLSETLDSGMKKSRRAVELDKQPAKALKLYEPKLTENFDPSRKERSGGRQKNEKERLVHKHKREMKGAVREVRRDAQFIAKHRLEQQVHRDAERKRKVQELMGQLSHQEGDFKSLKRKKNKL